ncbi:hypothetical protein HJC23_004542 [Cyclotella cryptica]|uniref:Uncharacterized protein n=1 Tax=Cyclotella cryptica TaxID=29204 RepID=A0ABD3QH00_9STRA|eukprot:CCRYP_007281-RA/>CCRYP_007281-RA protein AED:0.02 eAED:0.02 QI:268/1/1/1/1/1/2/109/487
MNSLGPSRRSWSTLTQDQPATLANDKTSVGCEVRPSNRSRQPKAQSAIFPSRKLPLRHLPLFVFSLATFAYFFIIYLHFGGPRSRADKIRKPVPKATPIQEAHRRNLGLVHVVQTRFMQHQPDLLQLGQARLELFETFCLPSMESQTNKNFLWIIRTDPDLHPSLLGKLVSFLKNNQNYILLGSNYNPEGFGREESDSFGQFLRAHSNSPEMSAKVLSGNITLIKDAFEKSNEGAVLLETRLDADDGLHRDFVKTVQYEARHLTAEGTGLWRIWCINYNMEWHPLNPFPASSESNSTHPEGYLVMYSDPNICVTPGLTFGYGSGAGRSSIGARLRHDQITRKITPCTADSKNVTAKASSKTITVGCFSRLSKLSPGAIRSRTTTSAGMDNVITGNESLDQNSKLKSIEKHHNKGLLEKFNKQYSAQNKLWTGLKILFMVSRDQAKTARSFIVGNMQQIAEDNLKGQCTPGHSCKNGTQSVLKSVSSF